MHLLFLLQFVLVFMLLMALTSLTPLQYPGLEPVLDDILPKKSPLIVVKWFVIFHSFSVLFIAP